MHRLPDRDHFTFCRFSHRRSQSHPASRRSRCSDSPALPRWCILPCEPDLPFPTWRNVMKKRICALLIVLVAIVVVREGSAAQQADLHVVAAFGIQGAMEKILPEYKRISGQNVSIEYEESAVIRRQIASGKIFDLAILVPQVIDDLIKSGQIKAGTRT